MLPLSQRLVMLVGLPLLYATTETREGGVFEHLLDEGRYLLHIDVPEGSRHVGWYGGESGFTLLHSEAREVEVGREDVSGIVVHLPDLTWYRIEGTVLGPDGNGIEGIRVEAVPAGEYPSAADDTDEEGAFSIFVLGGSFHLRLYFDNPDGRQLIGVYGGEDGFSPLSGPGYVFSVDGRDVSGVTIKLPADPTDLSQWRRLEGVVLGPNEEPQEGVTVDAYPAGKAPGFFDSTDGDGGFSVLVLPGPFTLTLYADLPRGRTHLGWYGGEAGFTGRRDEARIVDVGEEEVGAITINLPIATGESNARRISGVVVDVNGQALEGVEVKGEGPARYLNWSVTTDTEGRFEAHVLAWDYQVSFQRGHCPLGWYSEGSTLVSGQELARSLSTLSGDITDLRITAPDICARLQGVVVGPDGEPMESLQFQGLPEDGGRFWSTRTDAAGGFDTIVTPGVYRVRLLSSRCPLDWTSNARSMSRMDGFYRRLTVQPAGVTGLAFTLSDIPSDICRRLEGSAVAPDGQPVGGLQVNLTAENGGGFFAWHSGADGSFSFYLRDGHYAFSIASDRFNACRAGGLAQSSRHGRHGTDTFNVADEDAVGVRIVVSGQPPDRPGWTYCTLAE